MTKVATWLHTLGSEPILGALPSGYQRACGLTAVSKRKLDQAEAMYHSEKNLFPLEGIWQRRRKDCKGLSYKCSANVKQLPFVSNWPHMARTSLTQQIVMTRTL